MSQNIASMHLYVQLEARVVRELEALGYHDGDMVPPETLWRFDQLHYGGTEAVQESIDRCGITAEREVLEVGSGLAGPSRYIAHRTGCRVTALELQQPVHEAAVRLTNRCRLNGTLIHRLGDILVDSIDGQQFDAIVSWLVFLHIADRKRLFRKCLEHLRQGGWLYVEDYCCDHPFTDAEKDALRIKVQCVELPSRTKYLEQLRDAGFEIVTADDVTAEWTEFVSQRQVAFRARTTTYIQVHGKADYDRMDDFTTTVAKLFQGGNLGGIRLAARKPQSSRVPTT